MDDVTCAAGHPVPTDDYECEHGHPAVYAPPPRPLPPQGAPGLDDPRTPDDDAQLDAPAAPPDAPATGTETWVQLSVDGATTVARTPVLVGRDLDSPLAKALKDYLCTSRRHLVLERRGDVVTVVDISKLGTAWGDGRPLTPSERHEATLPLLLRLGDECTVYIEAHDEPAEGLA